MITSSNLVSNCGEENDVERTYVFKLVVIGEETVLEVEKLVIVVVADDISDLETVATINAKTLKMLLLLKSMNPVQLLQCLLQIRILVLEM